MSNNIIDSLTNKESINVLSVTRGQLEIARVPVMDAPDWIVPKALILAIEPYTERIWTYLWQGQEVAVYPLIPSVEEPSSLVILESITDVHRIALQIQGEISYDVVRLIDLQDVDDEVYQQALRTYASQSNESTNEQRSDQVGYRSPILQQSYVFQPVLLQGEICVVPDLDKLSHFMVDLDS